MVILFIQLLLVIALCTILYIIQIVLEYFGYIEHLFKVTFNPKCYKFNLSRYAYGLHGIIFSIIGFHEYIVIQRDLFNKYNYKYAFDDLIYNIKCVYEDHIK